MSNTLLILSALIQICLCMELNTTGMTLDEINDAALASSKKQWTEQFAPWEEKGFTKEMMDESRKFYHAHDFDQKRGGRYAFWTIIDGKIYKEYPPNRKESENTDPMEEEAWPAQIHGAAKHPNFPKKVQFWTRSKCDRLNEDDLAKRRFDLEFP